MHASATFGRELFVTVSFSGTDCSFDDEFEWQSPVSAFVEFHDTSPVVTCDDRVEVKNPSVKESDEESSIEGGSIQSNAKSYL